MNKTQEALKMAIKALNKEPNCMEDFEFKEEAISACKEALAELALEQMTENAKELGLDYCSHDSDSACKECYMEQKSYEQSWYDTRPKYHEKTPTATRFICTLENIDKNGIETWKLEPFFTLAELQAHDDEVIERCAKVCDTYSLRNDDMGAIIGRAIRALKGETK